MFLRSALIVLFFSLFIFGQQLSLHKALWNDELYTQDKTIRQASYLQIASGFIEEGGNAPLFYLLQKLILGVFNYQMPAQWEGTTSGRYLDDRSQIFIRILPNLCISASLVLIFYFFFTRFSLMAALLSMVIALSNYMLLTHWVEARPYAMYFLWGVLQIIFLFKWQEARENKGRLIYCLAFVHALIALTLSTATGLILIVGIVLYWQGVRSFKQQFFITILPLMAAVYYAGVTACMQYSFPYKVFNMANLWDEVFGLDWLLFLVISVIIFVVFKFKDFKAYFLNNIVLWVMLGVSFYAAFVLCLLKARELFVPSTGLIELNGRFFIFLAPWVIFISTLCIIKIFRHMLSNSVYSKAWVWQYCWFSFCFIVFHGLLVFKKIYLTSLYVYH